MTPKGEKIWLDGKIVSWNEAKVHILTHTLHYGLGVFEGIRAYELHDGKTAIFRLKDHIDRLYRSAHIMTLDIPFSPEELMEACKESLRVNGLKHGYIRPLIFIGEGEMGLYATSNPVRAAIIAWPWGTYLGEEGLVKGVRAKISSFAHGHVNATMTHSKTCGNYVNSILAKREALAGGYEEAIFLDTNGYVAEATGENIFIVQDDQVKTTPLAYSVLRGITRESVIRILADCGISLSETLFTRDELYTADEVFLTGTAAEITPIREIDDRKIGPGRPGPMTKKVQEIFFDIVRGRMGKYAEWLEMV